MDGCLQSWCREVWWTMGTANLGLIKSNICSYFRGKMVSEAGLASNRKGWEPWHLSCKGVFTTEFLPLLRSQRECNTMCLPTLWQRGFGVTTDKETVRKKGWDELGGFSTSHLSCSALKPGLLESSKCFKYWGWPVGVSFALWSSWWSFPYLEWETTF